MSVYADVLGREMRDTALDRLSAEHRSRFVADRLRFLVEHLDRNVRLTVDRVDPELATALRLRDDALVIEARVPDSTFLVRTLVEFFRRRGLAIQFLAHPHVGLLDLGDQVVIERALASGVGYSQVFAIVQGGTRHSLAELRDALEARLCAVVAVNASHNGMLERLASVRADIEQSSSGDESDEATELIDWMSADNFLFLAYAYVPVDGPARDVLGLAALEQQAPLLRLLSRIGRGRHRRAELVSCYRTDHLSIVKRETQLRYFGFQHRDERGETLGEHIFCGLLSSHSMHERNDRIPVVRSRMREVLASLDLHPGSFAYRRLLDILNSLPNEDLFYSTRDEAAATVEFIAKAEVSDHTRVRVWRRATGRRIAIDCVLPRARHREDLHTAIHEQLARTLGVERLRQYVRQSSSEDPVRYHFYVSSYAEPLGEQRLAQAREAVAALLETWSETLTRLLGASGDEATAARWAAAFGDDYRRDTTPRQALLDAHRIDAHRPNVAFDPQADGRETILSIYSETAAPLNDSVPILDAMGLTAEGRGSHRVHPAAAPPVRVSRFAVCAGDGRTLTDEDLTRLREVLMAALEDRLPITPLLGLGALAALDRRELEVLLIYRAHFLQVYPATAGDELDEQLLRQPEAVRAILDHFAARFDPDVERDTEPEVAARVERALTALAADRDRGALRRLHALVRATVRTNAYRLPERRILAIKLASARILDVPQPCPLFEVYVRGPGLEAIHLRGGLISRGGIRHSDRAADLRTEISALQRTQMIKNALIVPSGAKGGFVTPGLPPGDPAVEQRYAQFLEALLDVTDDIVRGDVVSPPRVVCHDGEDPYLVVAADKGTARFSDTANAVANARGYWLGDAFASGGATGYDHKKMGITARGAWACVRRHFAELGIDASTAPLRVVGVGDMSGDVFGNGMLRSSAIRLVAAFDHRHIFIDPTPDPTISFAERRRLFERDRSSWADYSAGLLSPGGCVLDRATIGADLPVEARRLLGLPDAPVSGDQIVQAILRADVDLLWFGGIGTFVKAASEHALDVADRANDAVRVDARDLRARVIGEGANLAMTPRARIEYTENGGRANTDALDNSAGVDCSDHEVNLKVLLQQSIAHGDVAPEERVGILRELADQIADLCIGNCSLQSRMVSLDALRAARSPAAFAACAERLSAVGHLRTSDRPDAGISWPRSVLAELAAAAKQHLKSALLQATETLDRIGELRPDLMRSAFPTAVLEAHARAVATHPLRREILATAVANRVIHQAGATFLVRPDWADPAALARRAHRYLLLDRELGTEELRRQLADIDPVAAGASYGEHLALEEAIESALCWWIWSEDKGPTEEDLSRVADVMRLLEGGGARGHLTVDEEPTAVARRRLGHAMQAIELLGHARSGGARDDVDALRGSHILASLHLDELWHVLRRLPTHDRWQRAFQVDLERDLLRTRSRILELRAKGVRIDTTPTPRLLEILHGLAPASAPASFVRVQVHLALAAVRELLSGKAIPECVEEAAS